MRVHVIFVVFLFATMIAGQAKAKVYEGWTEETLCELSISEHVPSMHSGYAGRNRYSCILSTNCETMSWEAVLGGENKIVYCNSDNDIEEYNIPEHYEYYLIQDFVGRRIAVYANMLFSTEIDILSRDTGRIISRLTSNDLAEPSVFLAYYSQDETIYYITYKGSVGCWSESNGVSQDSHTDEDLSDMVISELVYGTETGCFAVRPLNWSNDHIINWDQDDGLLYQSLVCDYSCTNTRIDASTSGNVVCMQNADNGAVELNSSTGKVERLYCPGHRVETLRVSPFGEYLAIGYRDRDESYAILGVIVELINLKTSDTVYQVNVDSLVEEDARSIFIHETTDDGHSLIEVRSGQHPKTLVRLLLLDANGHTIWCTDVFYRYTNVMNSITDGGCTEAVCTSEQCTIMIAYIDVEHDIVNVVRLSRDPNSEILNAEEL